ncbi:MAG: hypothetical protein R3221_04775 [Spongiibacter sp.]|nr:hypothetical protein [Spongiibacter sp.]
MTAQINRRIVLASRPVGAPNNDNFRLEEQPIPQPGDNEVLLRTIYLSLDPYMRGRMSDAKSYADPVAIGAVMTAGTVSRVVQSNNPNFKEGDWVLSMNGWQEYAISDGSELMPLGDNPQPPPTLWALWVCPASPPTWACSTSASPSPAKPWWSLRQPAP